MAPPAATGARRAARAARRRPWPLRARHPVPSGSSLHAVERREGGGKVVGVGGVGLQRAQQLARPVLAGLLVDVDGEGGLPRGVLRVLHGAAQGEVFLNLPVERGAALGGGLPRALRLSAAG